VAIALASGIIFYGMSLYKFMETAGGKKLSSSAKKSTSASQSAIRMKRGAFGFSAMLIAEGALWLVTSIDIDTFLNNELVLGSVFYSLSVVSMCIMLYLFKNGVAALDPNSTLSKQKSSTLLGEKKGSERLITRQESARSMRSASKSDLGRSRGGNSVSGRTRGATTDDVITGSPGSATSTLAAPLNADEEFVPRSPKAARRPSEDDVERIRHTNREVDALMSLGADLEVHDDEFNGPVDIELPTIGANPTVANMGGGNNAQSNSNSPAAGSSSINDASLSPVPSSQSLQSATTSVVGEAPSTGLTANIGPTSSQGEIETVDIKDIPLTIK